MCPTFASIVMNRHLNVDDGLIQSQVNAVLETSDGYVWLGTFGGVTRWDGTNFKNFQLSSGLCGLDVRAFHETLDGSILIATSDNGICSYRNGVFTTISTEQGLPSVSTRGFIRDNDGQLFVATGDGLFVFSDESLDPATARHLLPGVRVSGFAQRSSGGFYLSTFSHGVLVWNGTEAVPLLPAEDLPGKIIRCVHETHDGSVLISVYHNGVWVWHDGILKPFSHNEQFGSHDVMAFCSARDSTLYFSTNGGGIAVLKNDDFHFLTTDNGLPHNTSWAVHEGRHGLIYFATWDGVGIYNPGRFESLNMKSGLQSESIMAISELNDGSVALASIGAGVSLVDKANKIRVLNTSNGLEHNNVWSLLTARDGSLYIGTHAGMNRLHNGKLTTVFSEKNAPSGRIYCILEDKNGTIWLGTYGGIQYLKNGVPTLVYEEEDSHRSSVFSAAETKDGDLLFGTAKGLVIVRDGKEIIPSNDSPLASLHIWTIHQSLDGTVYLGTNGNGLLVYPDGLESSSSPQIITTKEGLSENVVFGIAEDTAGRIYATTQHGVSIITFKAGEPFIRQLHSDDGLANEECNQGACFADSRGRFWFGTIRGVSRYDPARDLPVTSPPILHWRRARLFTDELPLSMFEDNPVFGYQDNFFRFDFVATNPTAPHKVLYRHKLSGIDRGWVEEQETSVAYTSLPSGSYTLSVVAQNEWGYWSDPLNLSFKITPPFWKTWWFILVTVSAGAGIVALIVANRVRQMLAYEQLRTKIAADLHDDIGAGLTEISLVSQILEYKLPPEQQLVVQSEISQLGNTARQLVNSMRDIVWLVAPQRDSLHDLVLRLADTNQPLFQTAGIDFQLENLDSLANLKLGMEQRQHLYLIFKEAISNAVKYSECKSLRLSAQVSNNSVKMKLIDNGKGFEWPTASQGNGLKNMRARAEKLGGHLYIESAPGKGCTIQFTGK